MTTIIRNSLVAATLLVAPATASADVLVGEASMIQPDWPAPSPNVEHRYADDGTLISSIDRGNPMTFDNAVLSEDGWLYAGGSPVIRWRPGGSVVETEWLRLPNGSIEGLAFTSDGRLVAGCQASGHDFTGIYVVDPATRAVEIVFTGDARTDELVGLAVPKAGPFEDGILAIMMDPPGGGYFLRRFRQEADGSFTEAGRLGPLDVTAPRTCVMAGELQFWGIFTFGLSPRLDGGSFLAVDGCRSEIREFDLEGNLLRIVASIEPDLTLEWPPWGDSPIDHLRETHVAADGTIWAWSARYVWRFDPSGRLLFRLPEPFNWLDGVTDLEWRPFESVALGCEPSGLGWWKRQCLSDADQTLPRRTRRADPTMTRPRPPLHPASDAGDIALLFGMVDAQLAPHGVTACEALWSDSPQDPRSRALAHLAALLLDVADKRLATGCVVAGAGNAPGSGLSIGEAIEEIQELLLLGTPAGDREASRLAVRASSARRLRGGGR